MPFSRRRTWFAEPWLQLIVLALVAAFFRLWRIGAVPPGLFGDEATDGLDALDVLAGRGAVFFPANYGREGLHMWIVAGMFRVLGVTPLALRLPSAIAGILTVLATYWLGRELMACRRGLTASGPHPFESFLPFAAALYLATSYWHVHFSRFGIRGVFTPLCAALAFAALWRGLNRGRLQGHRAAVFAWFAASGFFLGLATHFYTASRFLPFFLLGFLILQCIAAWTARRPAEAILRRHPTELAVLFLVAGAVFLPLGVYFLQHPGSFTQRAGEVAATGQSDAWRRMGQAAVANVLQFFVPGRGDPAQFYNLPGRAVFDVLTALLALAGIVLLAWRWRRPAALFLLTWFPALLLPSFLATDRFPTLPRVLGVIPGVYFFPAVGLVGLAAWADRLVRPGEPAAMNRDATRPAVKLQQARSQLRFGLATGRIAAVGVMVVALGVHVGLTYRDYFRNWGPSAATFDAFEGDMTAAWQWLGTHDPAGHVYLSSDIYRHPTFTLLYEQASVQTIFAYHNPRLSMFDARAALPLPAPGGEPAVFLLAASSQPTDQAEAYLSVNGVVRDRVMEPGGGAALTAVEVAPAQATACHAIPFTGHLALCRAAWQGGSDGAATLWLHWQTAGPDMAAWPGYRLEIAAGERTTTVPFDGFRPTEWVAGGGFLTWHRFEVPEDSAWQLRLRLHDAASGQPITGSGAADGWRQVTVETDDVFGPLPAPTAGGDR